MTIDPRIDPTQRSNAEQFWTGYGRYREGVNYTEMDGPDQLAGWCYGLAEGRTAKPLHKSKTFYHGLALIGLAAWGAVSPQSIMDNPEAIAAIAAVLGVLGVWIRSVTKGPIK